MPDLFEVFFRYYGLDWAGFFCGITGMYLITQKIHFGFFLSGIACLTGVAVAMMAGQYGSITYNVIFLGLMLKAYYGWDLPKINPDRISALKRRARI